MWIDTDDARAKVTVIGASVTSTRMRRTRCWRFVARTRGSRYGPIERDGHERLQVRQLLLTTGPLDPRERDITWAWGWKSKAAKALRVMEALR